MKLTVLVVIGSILVLLADGRPSREGSHGDEILTASSGTSTSTTPANEVSEGRTSVGRRGETSLVALARNQSALIMMSFIEALDSDVLGTPTPTSIPSKVRKGAHNTRRETTGGIAFPTPPSKIRNTSNRGGSPQKPSACSTANTFCEQIDNYPMTDVNALLLSHGVNKYPEYFENPAEVTIRDLEIGSRSGVSTQLCKSTTRVIAPQAGRNLNGDYKIIAKNETYQQAIVVEQCEQVGKACDNIAYFPPHIEAKCVQKYVTRRLVTLNKERKGFETDKFQVPSCCSCELSERKSDR